MKLGDFERVNNGQMVNKASGRSPMNLAASMLLWSLLAFGIATASSRNETCLTYCSKVGLMSEF